MTKYSWEEDKYIPFNPYQLEDNNNDYTSFNSYRDGKIAEIEYHKPLEIWKSSIFTKIAEWIRDDWNKNVEEAKYAAARTSYKPDIQPWEYYTDETLSKYRKGNLNQIASWIWIWTNFVLSPLVWALGGIFWWPKKDVWAWQIGWVKEDALNLFSEASEWAIDFLWDVWKDVIDKTLWMWYEWEFISDFSKRKLWEWLFNIATGEIWIEGWKALFWWWKAVKIIDEWAWAYVKWFEKIEQSLDNIIEANNKALEDFKWKYNGWVLKEEVEILKKEIANGSINDEWLKSVLDRIWLEEHYNTIKKEVDDYYEIKKDLDLNAEVSKKVSNFNKTEDYKPFNYNKKLYNKHKTAFINDWVGELYIDRSKWKWGNSIKMKTPPAKEKIFKAKYWITDWQYNILKNNINKDFSQSPAWKIAQLYEYQQGKMLGEEWLWKWFKDTANNSSKAKLIIDLEEEWLIKMVKKENWLNQYKLTKEWEPYSKMLWFSEKEINHVKEKWLVHYPAEDISAVKKIRALETPTRKIDDYLKVAKESIKNIEWLYIVWDESIINSIKKFNEVFKVLDEAEIAKIITKEWVINSRELSKVVNKLLEAQKSNFVKHWKNISRNKILSKVISDIKKLTSDKVKIGYSKKLTEIIKKLSKKAYNLNKAKKLGKLINETEHATILKNINNAKIKQAVLHKNIVKLKSDILKGINLDIRAGKLTKNVEKIFKKNAIKQEFWKAETFEKTEALLKKLNGEVEKLHREWLIQEIKDAAKGKMKSNMNMNKDVRMKMSVWTRKELEEIYDMFNKWATDVLPTERLENLLAKIEYWIKEDVAIKNSNKNIKSLQSKHLVEAEKDNIKPIIWLADKAVNEWMISSAKKIIKTYSNVLKQRFFLFGDMFWRDSRLYNKFVNVPRNLQNKAEIFFSKHTAPLIDEFNKMFWKEINDFGSAIFARQIVKWENVWVLKSMWDPEKAHLFKPWKTTIEAPAWLDSEIWNLPVDTLHWPVILKNTRLWELIEKWETNPKWGKAKKAYKSYSDLVYEHSRKNAIETEWIDLPYREYYMHFDIIKSNNLAQKVDFIQDARLTDTFHSNHMKNVSNTVWKKIVYEHNPLKILVTEGRMQIYRNFMKKHFDELNEIANWRRIERRNLSDTEINLHLKWDDYSLITKEWVEIDKNTVKDWFAELDLWLEGSEIEKINVKDLMFRSDKEWVKQYVWRQWALEINNYLKLLARGWTYPKNYVEKLLVAVSNNYNILPLVGNPSSALKQLLSIWDAVAELWMRDTYKWTMEILSNPKSFKFLEENIPSIKTRAADIITKDSVSYTSYTDSVFWKWQKLFHKYKELWTLPLREIDSKVYSIIWYSSYKKLLKKVGKAVDLNHLDMAIVSKADDLAERIAWTANAVMQPEVYSNLVAKQAFWLFSTQLTRWNRYKGAMKEIIANKKILDWLKATTYFVWTNIAEWSVWYWIYHFMQSIWMKWYDYYEKSYLDNNSNMWIFLDATFWQSFWWSKIMWIDKWFSLAPVLWWIEDTTKALKDVFNSLWGWERGMDWVRRFIEKNFWWKFMIMADKQYWDTHYWKQKKD